MQLRNSLNWRLIGLRTKHSLGSMDDPRSSTYSYGVTRGTYSQSDVSDPLGMYLASIESLDYYINQLLKGMDQMTKENTLLIFIGDNGTDNDILRGYSESHGKGTLYEGGVRVPLIISGSIVSRKNATDTSMIQSLDLTSFILDYIGISNTFEDSQSFLPLLNSPGTHREYLYSESVNRKNSVYA